MKLDCTHVRNGAFILLGLGVLVFDSVTAAKFGEWSAPVNLGPLVNSPFDDISPHVSKNGLSLYFASTRNTGSFGGEDIWISSRATGDDPWGGTCQPGTNHQRIFKRTRAGALPRRPLSVLQQ